MVDNYMYDPKHGTEFLIGNNEDQYHSYWWDDGEPLWITATKQVSANDASGVFNKLEHADLKRFLAIFV